MTTQFNNRLLKLEQARGETKTWTIQRSIIGKDGQVIEVINRGTFEARA